jgi:hypothetical protein
MKFSKNRLIGIGIIFLLFLFSACGTLNRARITPEEALRKRVTAYWDARVQGDNEKAYELLEPDAKQTIGLATYVKRTSYSIIVNYKIHDIKVDLENNDATVRVERSFRIRPGVIPIKIDKTLEQTADSRWVFVDGIWYMRYASPKLNFKRPPPAQAGDAKN